MNKMLFFVMALLLVAIGYWLGQSAGPSGDSFPAIISSAQAQNSQPAEDELLVSPTEAREHDVYYPNSESLKPDEMRVIACGTGMPTTRAAQAAACFLVELGNGDKFLFDIGSGAAERISSLQIPYNFLDKVFVGHLHTDHFGALHDLFIGGALMGGTFRFASGDPVAKCPNWAPNMRWTV